MANEDKATHYHRLQRRASFTSTTAGVAFLVFLVGTGAARALLDAIESAAGPSRLAVTALFVAALIAAHELLVLPITYYRGVTLERRYGLSFESRTHWWLTHAKAVLVGGALTMVAALVVSALLSWSPASWWLVAAALFAALLVAMVWAAPVWLFPIFYDFAPARPAGADGPPRRAGTRGRRVGERRVRVAARRPDAQGQRGARRDWAHPPHPALGHAARDALG